MDDSFTIFMPVSRIMHIFIASEETLEDLIKDLELLLRLTTKRHAENDEIWYEFQDVHTLFSVGSHEYVNNKNINFEDYQYNIEVNPINIRGAVERMRHLEDSALFVFNMLKESQKYLVMLVDDLQSKIAEFCC